VTKIAHVIATINAGVGLLVLLGILFLTEQQLAGVMGFLALLGAAVGAFFDPRVPWYGTTTVEVTTPSSGNQPTGPTTVTVTGPSQPETPDEPLPPS
jgi:hypothetical protein